MYRDITEIKQFYRTPLGRAVTKRLRAAIRQFWPQDISGEDNLAGVGYALPFLNSDTDLREFAVMTATQGVVRWPAEGPARVVLTEDHILPLAEQMIARVLLVHAVENAEYLRELMRDVWRVLAPEGRVLLVVPNRAGLWARADKTPFGFGRPYSMKQLRQLLNDLNFVIEHHSHALYLLPSHRPIWRSMSGLFEYLGARFLPKCGGVILVEASKRLYNVTPLPVTAPAVASRALWQPAGAVTSS